MLHGIVMIDQNINPNIWTQDRQGLSDKQFLQGLREDIWKSYRKWKKSIEQAKEVEANVDMDKDDKDIEIDLDVIPI